MKKDIYSLGSSKVVVSRDITHPSILITTKHGQVFEVFVDKDSIQVTANNRGVGITYEPISDSTILVKEK